MIVHNRYKNDYLVRRDKKRDRSIDIDIKIEKALIWEKSEREIEKGVVLIVEIATKMPWGSKEEITLTKSNHYLHTLF